MLGGKFANNSEFKQFWKMHKYIYLIDYKDNNCPSAKEFINERTNLYSCNDKYMDCYSGVVEFFEMFGIFVISIILMCVLSLIYSSLKQYFHSKNLDKCRCF